MIRQRMDDHYRVLPGLHYLVKVANRPFSDGPSQRAVNPRRLTALQQKASDQVGRGQVFVPGDSDDVAPQLIGHRLHEPGLATSRWSLDEYRQAPTRRRTEHRHFVPDWVIEL